MKKTQQRMFPQKLVLALAVSATMAGSVLAQYRVDNGNANDSNNRVGGGGVNGNIRQTNSGARFNGVSSNDVVYGNVTGGKEFRGNLQSTDPRAFRGFTAGGLSDRFIRSSGSGYYGSNAQTTQGFYGDSRGVAPPTGFQRQGYVGGYIPAPIQTRSGSDLRLGDVLDAPMIAPARPGDLMLPGPVDASNANTLLSASPVYGIRQMRADSVADQDFTGRYNDMYRGLNETRSQMNNDALLRMRNQLEQQSVPVDQATDPNAAPNTNGATGTGGAFSLAPNSAANTAIANDPVAPMNAGQNAPLGAGLQTNQGNRVRMLMQAGEQTPELQALQKQYIDSYTKNEIGTNDATAARNFNQLVQAMEKAKAESKNQRPGVNGAATPGGSSPGGTGAGGTGPGATTPGGAGSAVPGGDTMTPGATTPPDIRTTPSPTNSGSNAKPKPIQIKTLTGGVKVKEFADILSTAENNMKQGKWITAIEDYDQARVAAPNNPLILVGRANANLGAAYYTKADADLRSAFTAEEALLLGQYDLRAMMGDERIEFIAKDLKEIAKKNPTQARPYFLLAYVYYNIGEERKASGYLSLAEKYAATGDTFYGVVRQHWVLPEGDQPADEQNK